MINAGCSNTDSVYVNVIKLETSLNQAICNGDSIVVNGTIYNSTNPTGTEVFNSVGLYGCDSTVMINLSFVNNTTGTDTRTECDSLVWIDGNTYISNNNTANFNIVGGAVAGCDSLVTLDLTITSLDTSITQTNDTLTSNETTGTYQWIDCGNGDTIITGATNQNYQVTTNGDYAVIVTIGSCSDTSSCFNVTVSGIDENILDNTFSIYPNPTKNQLIISFNEVIDNSYTISVKNSLGQVVNKFRPNEQRVNLDLSTLDKGVYFINIANFEGSKTVKVIKQ